MELVLTATMTHRVIAAALSGIEVEDGQSCFARWWLDGTAVKDTALTAGKPTTEYTFESVAYKATHRVFGQVWETTDTGLERMLATASAVVTDPLSLWTWEGSNGTATTAQTVQAYEAVTEQGLARDFNHKVWNDLVTVTADTIAAMGLEWSARYATKAGTLMASGDALTDTRFNSLVQNLQTPYPYWLYRSGRKGYLGRKLIYGMAARGELGDIVYGDYLLELAHLLNVLLDAVGEFGAGYAALLAHSANSAITSAADLPLLARESRRMDLTDTLAAVVGALDLRAPESRHLARTDDILTAAKLTASAPPADHMVLTNRNRSIRSIDLIAQNERPLDITGLLGAAGDMLLTADPATALALARALASDMAAALSPIDSLVLGATLASLTVPGLTLSPSPVTDLAAGIGSTSGLDGTLTPAEESALAALAGSLTGSDVVLAVDETAALAHIWAGQTSTGIILLDSARSRAMAHSAKLATLVNAALRAGLSAPMAHTARNVLAEKLTAVMRAPRAARLSHAAAMKLNMQYLLALSADQSVHMAYTGAEKIATTHSAVMRTPMAARMVYTAAEAMAAALNAALAADESRHMAYTAAERFITTATAALHPADSRHMAADLTAPDGKTEAVLVPIDSFSLSAEIADRLNDKLDANLSPVDGTPLAADMGAESGGTATLSKDAAAQAAHSSDIHIDAETEMRSPSPAKGDVVSVCITVLHAVLEAKPTVEPSTDWATQDGTNLDIRRTYYNRADEADGSVLLIDQAWYQEPVQVGANLAITSEGYNDYGLEGTDENEV